VSQVIIFVLSAQSVSRFYYRYRKLLFNKSLQESTWDYTIVNSFKHCKADQ